MNQRLTTAATSPSPQPAPLSSVQRLLAQAEQLVDEAPDHVGLTLTLSAQEHGDSIIIQVDSKACMEDRCGVVDWFARKLNGASKAGAPVLSESGYASYATRAELGAHHKTYVDVYTPIAKAAR